jgi:hypothetical protein
MDSDLCLHLEFGTDGSGKHVTHRVIYCLRLRQEAVSKRFFDERMISRDLGQYSRSQAVRATIADMRDESRWLGTRQDHEDDERSAHPKKLRTPGCFLANRLVRSVYDLMQQVTSRLNFCGVG